MTGHRKGFTLIELLIVVVVISLLASIALPKFSSVKLRASRSAGVADLHTLATQQEKFFVDSSRYGNLADTGLMGFSISPANTNLAITLTGTPAGTSGWNGTLTIPGNQTCGVFVGAAPRPAGMPLTIADGTPACW